MLFFEKTTYLPFLYHKSATTCQLDSYKVSNSKLKPDLCNCAKAEIIESMASPHSSNTKGTQSCWDTLCISDFTAKVVQKAMAQTPLHNISIMARGHGLASGSVTSVIPKRKIKTNENVQIIQIFYRRLKNIKEPFLILVDFSTTLNYIHLFILFSVFD